jgi:hypothetical protein
LDAKNNDTGYAACVDDNSQQVPSPAPLDGNGHQLFPPPKLTDNPSRIVWLQFMPYRTMSFAGLNLSPA